MVVLEHRAQPDGELCRAATLCCRRAPISPPRPGARRARRAAPRRCARRVGLLGAALQPFERGVVGAAQAGGRLFGLDAQPLLGVLALLDAAQLDLALGELLRQPARARPLAGGDAGRQVGLQRAHRRLGRLCAASRAGLPSHARRARRSEARSLSRGAPASSWGITPSAYGRLGRIRDGSLLEPRAATRGDSSRPRTGSLLGGRRSRQAMRECSEKSSMKPGAAVCEKRPPDSEKEARPAS